MPSRFLASSMGTTKTSAIFATCRPDSQTDSPFIASAWRREGLGWLRAAGPTQAAAGSCSLKGLAALEEPVNLEPLGLSKSPRICVLASSRCGMGGLGARRQRRPELAGRAASFREALARSPAPRKPPRVVDARMPRVSSFRWALQCELLESCDQIQCCLL